METVVGESKMQSRNKGFTLVEVLAALTLLSMVLILAGSIHLFGEKQSKVQSTDIQNQADVRLAMTILTKAIRSADSVSVPSTNELTVTRATGTDRYKFENNSLKKNDEPLVSGLQVCSFTPIPNAASIQSVSMTITSKDVPATTLTTTIYMRE